MPWRNGGGTTTEIVVEPSGEERFLYRVSIADVASDGPFSRFDGYDRHIMLLEGRGMSLDCGAHGKIDLALLEPRSFSGDWDVVGSLVEGAVRDFNLMVDRGGARSSLDVLRIRSAETIHLPPGATGVAYVIEGTLANAAEGDTLVLRAAQAVELVPTSAEACLAVARVTPR